ncbi:dephospho-CoA kinase [Hydrogenophaga palleronii]|uniref:Dephospho-CoA kinase n=1 Tax=Hydrogenophaga palleronii TaxID=65655 RepID=A0ABU1WP78_9BURK|nr:dephospho-CoA kinase [Hydrogenophaga palleronii]MDR7151095.1 dephospho-CoA kinase [Hydrogenophaga palleronii]
MPVVHRLGLTGGIGSGKSSVARLLEARGAEVIDADAISRACTAAGGSAMRAIAETFGPDFVDADGALHRGNMRQHVFTHPDAKAQLEGILHPLIAAQIRLQAGNSNAPCLVFDVPLLVESPRWRPQLDHVVVVDCTQETQVRRVQNRNGWDLATITRVMQQQSTRSQRLAAADIVLFNDGNEMEHLRSLVSDLAGQFGL